jgi:hypothetical protein
MNYNLRSTPYRVINNKKTQANRILKLLKDATQSKQNYSSTKMPFFQRSFTEDFRIDSKIIDIDKLPRGLNNNIVLLYQIIGDPTKEVYINEWTILSFNEVIEKYKKMCKDGQTNVFDIAYRYNGMGYIKVLSCNLFNHLFFIRDDGGSNGYDCAYNYKKIINFDYKTYEYYYFTDIIDLLLSVGIYSRWSSNI